MTLGRRDQELDLVQLGAELAAADVDVGAGLVAYAVGPYSDVKVVGADGTVRDLGPEASAVLVMHVPLHRARNGVLAIAQSSVGVRIDNLTPAQVRALLACLLFRAGAIGEDLVVQPLGVWVR